MENPWKAISLHDYESHMGLDTVQQLQALARMMDSQFSRYQADTAMVLGVAGGNGLGNASVGQFEKVYGVDLNPGYLEACRERYASLGDIFEAVEADLTERPLCLPQADLLIANLLIEYVGYGSFQEAVKAAGPLYVSCIIQINTDGGFVSDSPYLHAFDGLASVYREVSEEGLLEAMEGIGYTACYRERQPLPNGKGLLRLDYARNGQDGAPLQGCSNPDSGI